MFAVIVLLAIFGLALPIGALAVARTLNAHWGS
jgi:hypothetical protein